MQTIRRPNWAEVILVALSASLMVCWIFPQFWYRGPDAEQTGACRIAVRASGWSLERIPLSQATEAALAADSIFNGEFRRGSEEVVRVFMAERGKDDSSQTGLFVHTPDRCWTEAGWKIAAAGADTVEAAVGSRRVRWERRLFSKAGHVELVYFAGLAGGKTLPYRLDHNLSVGRKLSAHGAWERTGTGWRAISWVMWRRAWEALVTRRALFGTKQFLRISTALSDVSSAAQGDERLQTFLRENVEWRPRVPPGTGAGGSAPEF